MKKLYVCPHCGSEHSGIASAWEWFPEAPNDGYVPVFDCGVCGHWFDETDGFIGYEGQPDDNPNDDIPSGALGLYDASGHYDQ